MRRPVRHDAVVPGLQLIVQPSGKKSWAIRFRHHGHSYKKTLGQYPKMALTTARDLAREDFDQLAKGKNPVDQRQANPNIISELVARFLERHVAKNNKPKTVEETTRYLNNTVLPRWGKSLASDISKSDVIALLDDIERPVAANRCFAAIRKMFSWAVAKDLLQVSPCMGVERPAKETPRSRALSDAELAAVYGAAGKLGWPYGTVVQLLCLTGQRRGEIAGMEWSEIDLARKVWMIPAAKTKNSETHLVPLSAPVIAILESLPRPVGSDLVFSTTGDTAVSGFSKWKSRIDAMLPQMTADWTLHHIRRSVVTGMGESLAAH